MTLFCCLQPELVSNITCPSWNNTCITGHWRSISRKLKLWSFPIRIWTKIFDSVIVPIALYGSEVWGPLSRLEHDSWDKHPIETLHTEFCRRTLNVQRKTPNNACRAELGRFPLLLNIQKRAITFWTHLNLSQKDTLHFKALKNQELNPENSALSQLMVTLTNEAPIPSALVQNNSTEQNRLWIIQKINI